MDASLARVEKTNVPFGMGMEMAITFSARADLGERRRDIIRLSVRALSPLCGVKSHEGCQWILSNFRRCKLH